VKYDLHVYKFCCHFLPSLDSTTTNVLHGIYGYRSDTRRENHYSYEIKIYILQGVLSSVRTSIAKGMSKMATLKTSEKILNLFNKTKLKYVSAQD